MQVSTQERTPTYRVDQNTLIACPPSIVLEAIERYFKRRGKALDLSVPVKDIEDPDILAPDAHVTVDSEAHPNKSFIGRYDDRLVLRWYANGERVPRFTGRFTIRPLLPGTELTLKGQYQLPLGLPRRCARCRIQLLLETLKAVLETEFEAKARSVSGPSTTVRYANLRSG